MSGVTVTMVRARIDDNSEWEITVLRHWQAHAPEASPKDVPADVRAELRAWLDSAEDGAS